MSKKLLVTFEPEQFDKLSQNHMKWVMEHGQIITLQEYTRRILAAQDNVLKK